VHSPLDRSATADERRDDEANEAQQQRKTGTDRRTTTGLCLGVDEGEGDSNEVAVFGYCAFVKN